MKYYLTKSNPRVYKLREALTYYRSHPEIELYWTVPKHVNSGDILFIGQSGKDAGIYAVAIIASIPTLEALGDDFFVDPDIRITAWVARIESLTEKPHPALELSLKAFPILVRVAKWLRSQGAVRYLTDEEGEAIVRFV